LKVQDIFYGSTQGGKASFSGSTYAPTPQQIYFGILRA